MLKRKEKLKKGYTRQKKMGILKQGAGGHRRKQEPKQSEEILPKN